MVKIDNLSTNAQSTGFKQTNQSQFTGQQNQNQSQFSEPNQSTQQPTQKGLVSIPPALMQLIPWIPFAFEALSGQKIPAMGGTMGEIQSSLAQIQLSLSNLLNAQQQITVRLQSLENNASQQLNHLSQQVASTNKSFHLLATETKRSLEFNPRPQPERESNSYEENDY